MAVTASFASRLVLGESPRWHAGRLWVCDWDRRELVAIGARGGRQVMATVPSAPFTVSWSTAGHLLVLAGPQLLAAAPGRRLRPVADLDGLGTDGWNDVVVDGDDNAYVTSVGEDPVAAQLSEPGGGTIARITPVGQVRQVADGLSSPAGMAVTPDGSTLLVAESSAHRITAFTIDPDGGLARRRVWAHLGHVVPGGLCLDAAGAVWCADVPQRRCVRVREGGEVLDEVRVPRGWFSCALGGRARPTLYVVGTFWTGHVPLLTGEATGRVLAVPAPAPAADRARSRAVPAGSPVGRDPGRSPAGDVVGAAGR